MLTLFVEHELVGGKTVVEEFGGVKSFNNPPMTDTIHLSFTDGESDEKKLNYGTVVRGKTTND